MAQVGGATFGAGGTLLAYHYMDQPGGDRFTQPSVMYGVGLGAAGGVAWWLSRSGMYHLGPAVESGLGAFALSGISAGLIALAIPKKGTGAQQQSMTQSEMATGPAQQNQPQTGSATLSPTSGQRQRDRSRTRR